MAPVAERRAEPLAAGHRRARLAHQPRGVVAERGEPGRLLVDERVERGLDAVAERRAVPLHRRLVTPPRLASGQQPAGGRPAPRLLRMAHEQTRRIGDLVRDGERSFSFEFFPPKDEAGEEQLWQAISELEPYRPTFVSVTYGAGGSTRDTTVRVTGRIAAETSMTAMAHLTCVGHTRGGARGRPRRVRRRRHRQRDGAARRPRGGAARDRGPRRRAGSTHATELVELARERGGLQHRRRGVPRGAPVGRVARPATPTCWSPRRGPARSSR